MASLPVGGSASPAPHCWSQRHFVLIKKRLAKACLRGVVDGTRNNPASSRSADLKEEQGSLISDKLKRARLPNRGITTARAG
jgi:hypothetical protein